MKTSNLFHFALLGIVILSAGSALAIDQQRDQLRTHKDDPQYLQTQDRDRLQICCQDLMTQKEIEEYKREYLALRTEQARNQFRHRHEVRMRVRTDTQGFTPPDPGLLYRRRGDQAMGAGSV